MRVVVVPAVGLGFVVAVIIAFAAGAVVTEEVVRKVAEKIAQRKRSAPIMRRRTPTDEWTDINPPRRLSEEAIDKITFIGGVIAAVPAAILLLLVINEWYVVTWYVLTAIGFFAGLLSFAFYLRRS